MTTPAKGPRVQGLTRPPAEEPFWCLNCGDSETARCGRCGARCLWQGGKAFPWTVPAPKRLRQLERV